MRYRRQLLMQVNLKQTLGTNDSAIAFQGFVPDEAACSLHQQLESLSLQRLVADSATPGQQKRSDLSLSFLPVRGCPQAYGCNPPA